MGDGDDSVDPGADATRPEDERVAAPVDQVVVAETASSPSRAPLLVGLGVLVVAVLAIGAFLVGSGSDDDQASSSLPKLGVVPQAQVGMAADMEGYAPTYELAGALPDLGSTSTTYRVDGAVSEDLVAKWATVLDVGAPERSEWGWTAAGPDAYLEVYAYEGSLTSVQYSWANPSMSTTPTEPYDPSNITTTTITVLPPAPVAPADVPSDDEALVIARGLLDDMGVVEGDWSFESDAGAQFASVGCAVSSDAGDEATTTCVDGTVESQIWSRTVVATPKVDGVDADALFWNVTVGSGGRIESVSGTYGSARPVGDYPIVPTSEAFAQLRDGTAVVMGGPSGYEAISTPIAEATTDTTTSFEGPITTTTYGTSPPTEPRTGESTTEVVVDPVPSITTGPDIGSTDSTANDMVSGVPPIRITGAHLGLATAQGQVDGAAATLLLPVYVFELDPEEYPDARGIAVLALEPGSFDVLDSLPFDGPVGTVAPDSPVGSGSGGSGSSGSGSGDSGSGEPDFGDMPGTTATIPGSSDPCPGNGFGAPTTFACGPDAPVSSDTVVSPETTVPGGD